MVRAVCVGFVLCALATAGQARASLVYERGASEPIVVAHDDGFAPRVVAHGQFPVVSSDGRWVVYLAARRGIGGPIRIVSTHGGRPRTVVRHGYAIAAENGWAGFWSPDGRNVVADAGDELGAGLISATGGRRRFIPLDDTFGGAVFSPDGRRLYVAQRKSAEPP